LSEVWGIGPTTAEKFYYKGIKTIEDLRKNEHLLNDNQKVPFLSNICHFNKKTIVLIK